MSVVGWAQIGLFFLIVLALTRPLGTYLFRVFEGDRQPAHRVFGPIERLLFRWSGVDPKREQTWLEYTAALLAFSVWGILLTYLVQRVQALLPLNPQGLGPVSPDLAFNTAV